MVYVGHYTVYVGHLVKDVKKRYWMGKEGVLVADADKRFGATVCVGA